MGRSRSCRHVLLLAHAGLPLLPLVAWRRLRGAASWSWPAAVAGGLLPDALDKPLGYYLLDWGTGRLWGHTALVGLAIALGALALRGPRRRIVGGLAYGLTIHLLLDTMWQSPQVLLWPVLGPMPHGDWSLGRSLASYGDPYFLGFEVLGAASIALAAWDSRRRPPIRSSRPAP